MLNQDLLKKISELLKENSINICFPLNCESEKQVVKELNYIIENLVEMVKEKEKCIEYLTNDMQNVINLIVTK